MNKRKVDRRKIKRLKPNNNLALETDMRLNQVHPLLNVLVLENLFPYLQSQIGLNTLASYRVVCKVWDREIAKLLRKGTQINLTKILAPYPEGMGWTASQENVEAPFHYEVPYPQVRPFDSIFVDVNSCLNISNPQWINWFQIMGSQVKSLRFSCPFNCFCQNRFLEQILKNWFPNLECLELHNVKCITSLLLLSKFVQNSTDLICKNLETLRISVDGKQSFSLCKNIFRIDNTLLDIRTREFCMDYLVKKLANVIQTHALDSRNAIGFPEIVNFSDGKVILSPQQFKHADPHGTVEDITNYTGWTDGGIVAKLMKEIDLKKLELCCLDDHMDNLLTFFHLRPNKWRVSLKELDFNENLSKSITELLVIAQVKFPVTRLKLSAVHDFEDNEEMTRFLSYFSETLEILEISGPSVQQEKLTKSVIELKLPLLPKLRIFKHENVTTCLLTADNLWRNAPNLEKCVLKESPNRIWDENQFFGNSLMISNTVMKELKLGDVNCKQAELILDWFPNLVKLDFGLTSLGKSSLGFFGKLEDSKVKELKIRFFEYLNKKGKRIVNHKSGYYWEVGNIKGLASLELRNKTDFPLYVVPKPFSEAKLTSLKLINFRMLPNEKDKILGALSHIPSVEWVDFKQHDDEKD